MLRSIIDKGIQQPHIVRNRMRYFTSDMHFGHPLVTALRGFLNNGRLRAEYLDIWQTQTRAAAHAWIKQYVYTVRHRSKRSATSHATRTPSSAISTRSSGTTTNCGFSATSPTVAPSSTHSNACAASTAGICI